MLVYIKKVEKNSWSVNRTIEITIGTKHKFTLDIYDEETDTFATIEINDIIQEYLTNYPDRVLVETYHKPCLTTTYNYVTYIVFNDSRYSGDMNNIHEAFVAGKGYNLDQTIREYIEKLEKISLIKPAYLD